MGMVRGNDQRAIGRKVSAIALLRMLETSNEVMMNEMGRYLIEGSSKDAGSRSVDMKEPLCRSLMTQCSSPQKAQRSGNSISEVHSTDNICPHYLASAT
jgi:hypothetical protein